MPEKPSKLMPAIYGGVIMGLISGIPFLSLVNCLCCAGIMFGGLMAVFFYKKDLRPDQLLTSSDALALGALAGVVGAVVSSILTVALFYLFGDVARQAMYRVIEQMGVLDQMPPEARDQMEQSMHASALSGVTIFFSFIIDPLFGLLGGLIGYGVFKSRNNMNLQPPVMPPPPPQVTPPHV